MTLTVNNLEFAYPDAPNEVVLQIEHWQIALGECVFVHGPSGSGKSTLLNIISGMLPTSQGEITFLDQRIDQMSARQRDRFRARHMGYVFQQFNLIPYLSVIDNIRLARYLSSENTQSSSSNADIKSLLTRLNIDASHWQKPTALLSIGQQQRVAIARSFINQPELLIVDEPTSSLDSKNRDDFMSLLLSEVAQNNSSLIFVSHDLSLASHFNRVESLQDINAAISTA